uniref:mediator of RNA polymerase II transcription subunit 15a-like isoform X2 n=1 Tax=Fragaria vesca subsp. vesca TaxID=101020 RepID=UPI0005C927EC|nr:PREDICTED: mediator of RNA polymerase II transcription subunit 15a-like isoform X2 [Fragaria vesca subsp. vesca]
MLTSAKSLSLLLSIKQDSVDSYAEQLGDFRLVHIPQITIFHHFQVPRTKRFMDNYDGNPSLGGEPAMDTGDWRCQLQADSRERIVNKISGTLKRHLPLSGQEGLVELKKIAVRFEEKIYAAATSQSDYLRKISLKMLTMEAKSPNTVTSSLQSNSAATLDSTVQIGAEWQEEVYQKIKVMKEMYLTKLTEIYQKNAIKLEQLESLPQQPKSYRLEKLKIHKTMLEHLITVLQVSKSNISPVLKGKLGLYEKQIISFINTNKPKKPDSSLQQGQLTVPSMEHSHSQATQVQSPENQMNPQLQSKNLQSSVPTMQQNNITGLQQNSISSLSGVSTARRNKMNPLQPSSNMDPGQGTSPNSLQQVPVGSIQQIPVGAPQQANMNALSSQNGINMLQNNINPLQSNPGILHSQHLKQQEQQLYQNQLMQQYQQRVMQQQLLQQRLMQQKLMQKQQIIQQQQQLQQQAKQQLPGQLQAHQMPQLHQISDVDDVKIRPGSVKPGTFLSGDGLQQNSVSSLSGVSTAQQNMMNPLQSSSNADPGQGVSHQLNAGFLHNRFLQQQQQLRLMFLQSQQRQLQEQLMQKNQIFQQRQQQEIQHLLRKLEPELPQVNVVNDMNTSALLSSQSESNMLQGSIDSLNSSSRMGDNKQHQKQEQEEKVFQNQLKQPYQQLQMQQQWTQKPQMLQEKQQQQIQQLQQQTKQQLHHIYFIYLIFLAILLGAYLFGTGY